MTPQSITALSKPKTLRTYERLKVTCKIDTKQRIFQMHENQENNYNKLQCVT